MDPYLEGKFRVMKTKLRSTMIIANPLHEKKVIPKETMPYLPSSPKDGSPYKYWRVIAKATLNPIVDKSFFLNENTPKKEEVDSQSDRNFIRRVKHGDKGAKKKSPVKNAGHQKLKSPTKHGLNLSFISQQNESEKRKITAGELVEKGARLRRKSCNCSECGQQTGKQTKNLLTSLKTDIKQIHHLEELKKIQNTINDSQKDSTSMLLSSTRKKVKNGKKNSLKLATSRMLPFLTRRISNHQTMFIRTYADEPSIDTNLIDKEEADNSRDNEDPPSPHNIEMVENTSMNSISSIRSKMVLKSKRDAPEEEENPLNIIESKSPEENRFITKRQSAPTLNFTEPAVPQDKPKPNLRRRVSRIEEMLVEEILTPFLPSKKTFKNAMAKRGEHEPEQEIMVRKRVFTESDNNTNETTKLPHINNSNPLPVNGPYSNDFSPNFHSKNTLIPLKQIRHFKSNSNVTYSMSNKRIMKSLEFLINKKETDNKPRVAPEPISYPRQPASFDAQTKNQPYSSPKSIIIRNQRLKHKF